MRTYSAIEIAYDIIDKGIREERFVNALQLQKMLYFIQQESLRLFGVPAFEEPITAETYGPIVRSVFNTFSLWGAKPITRTRGDHSNTTLNDPEMSALIEQVFDSLQPYEAWQLVSMYNSPESAWNEVWTDGEGIEREIPHNLILAHVLPLPE